LGHYGPDFAAFGSAELASKMGDYSMGNTMLSASAVHVDARQGLSEVCLAQLGPDLRVLDADDSFLEWIGQSAADVRGEFFENFIAAEVKQAVMRHLDLLVEGSRLHFEERLVPIRSAKTKYSGRLTGLAMWARDGEVAPIVFLARSDNGTDALWSPEGKGWRLSEMDALILEGVAAGRSTAQMASRLYLSKAGVGYHVATMLRRFECASRSELVAKAYARGLLTTASWPPKVNTDHIA
jgi:DNA-binding CsgD family transcriptional regulator